MYFMCMCVYIYILEFCARFARASGFNSKAPTTAILANGPAIAIGLTLVFASMRF